MPTLLFTLEPNEDIVRQIKATYPDLLSYRNSALPYHITILPPVKVDIDKINPLLDELTGKLNGIGPLEIDFDSLGRFDDPDKVIYLHPHQEPGETSSFQLLHDRINNVLHDITGKFEMSDFEPHLTLARRIPEDDMDRLYDAAQEDFSPLHFATDTLKAYQLSPEGIWQEISELKLG